MIWIDVIANKIIEKYPDKGLYTCQCGVSTTGLAHFGNYRELVITYCVAKALEQKGKKTRCVLSFDDFDRFKKLSSDMPREYEDFIGLPNYSIPSPKDPLRRYAEYYEDLILKNLEDLKIIMQPVYQHKKYLTQKYLGDIRKALERKDILFEVINRYKTKPEKSSKSYYPISLYCEKCGKDFTTIDGYDAKTDMLTYHCICGYSNKEKLAKLHVKCNFKLDWSIRWKHEDVVFEPAGKSHMEQMGAYVVSSEISRTLLNFEPPIVSSYEFVTIAGQKGRMSKTVGDIVTMEDALCLYGRDMVLWLLAYKRPSQPVRISLTDGVKELYAKYEAFLRSEDEESIRFRVLLDINEDSNAPRFNVLCNEIIIWGKSMEELLITLKVAVTESALKKAYRAKYYCENILQQNLYRVGKLRFDLLSSGERILIKDFFEFVDEGITAEILKEQFNKEYRTLSKVINMFLFGKKEGPSIKRILQAYPLLKIKEELCDEKWNNSFIEQK